MEHTDRCCFYCMATQRPAVPASKAANSPPLSFKKNFVNRTVNLFSVSSYLQQLESDNYVRLSYAHLHLFCLEVDVPLILCKQRLEQSTSLQLLFRSIFDDCAQYNVINCINSLQRFPVSFSLCVLPATITLAFHRLPALM